MSPKLIKVRPENCDYPSQPRSTLDPVSEAAGSRDEGTEQGNLRVAWWRPDSAPVLASRLRGSREI
jgi:hypothetical protein